MLKAMTAIKSTQASELPPTPVLAAYGVFLLGAGGIWHLVAGGAFSSILTVSVMLQCLGIALLFIQVMTSGSAAGISARALIMDVVSLACRLSSTLWLNGYLPVDASGDYIFQGIDITSFLMICCLLRHVLVNKVNTYQKEEDSLPIMWMFIGSFVAASLLHGNMNNRPLFDTLWMASLFLGTLSVLPQLWLVTRTGGKVEALTSHHIAAMAASRALGGIFMWHARGDITCVPWVSGINHAIWAILGAHALHLILLGDFGYFYVKAIAKHGLQCRIEIESVACGV